MVGACLGEKPIHETEDHSGLAEALLRQAREVADILRDDASVVPRIPFPEAD